MYNRIRHYSLTPYPVFRERILLIIEQVKKEHHRSPTIHDLSKKTGISIEMVIEALEFNVLSNRDSPSEKEGCALH
ncbi:hypothetical protein [Pseudalkalibacillus sp. SCS-8]|uniref:hypothetical protein n=1 Tax=Pseudalkalibacillus nanhaiensis TaxID=3115291 RepID=UPI0032DAF6A3